MNLPPLLDALLRLLVLLVGAAIVITTIMAAVRTVVLPRGDNVTLTRLTFRLVGGVFRLRARRETTYEGRDRVMALYAPVALLAMPVVWLVLVVIGYTLIYWSLGPVSLYDSFRLSGSSIFTLGFFTYNTLPTTILEFSQAIIGLGLVALLISYLPTMYAAFSRRETLVTLLEVRADSPPSAVTLIVRANGIRGLDYLKELWVAWEIWFAEIDESHTSLAAINYFRSPQSDRSWITAAGAILDAAALVHSSVAIPRTAESQLCIRAGFVALRHIADFFGIPYDPDPHFPDPISVTRQEFEEALDTMTAAGVPIVQDRDQAWQDFAGWRVNYDTVLLALCDVTMAPYAPWSSDRGPQHRPK